jgi:hypothetical protein
LGEARFGVSREFFRIVRGREPSLEDFRSLRALGRGRPRNLRYEREWAEGVSVYDDFDQACKMARANRFRQGTFIVKIVIPEDSGIEFRQTFTEHHYTIYGEPEQILAYADAFSIEIPNAPGD